eukprot:CAMPEP_0194385690 /NCGR_PEP_ID=MMETSP0174-20130528/81985_1 /TAXON_ID=216777 /ORGANISM="Proboscia alata, Strain PI-D3" /LENGTH=136 /DNA_ID=CAMNT_0039174099 /DNA_START=114 /DNA_END=521 /DNA_ORIENTATION=-
METPRDYPKKIIEDIFEDVRLRIRPVSALEALRNYEERPHIRFSPTYEFLHFAVVSSLTVMDNKIHFGTLFMDNDNHERDVGHFRIFDAVKLKIADIDIVDAKGNLFQTRILIKSEDDYCDSLCYGKVYDRANGFR